MFKILSIIGQTIIGIIALYALAVMFNFMPEKYSPDNLFKNFKTTLSQDATSKSPTAKVSRAIYDYINKSEKEYKAKQEADAEQKANDEQEAEENNPISKAKEAVGNFEKQMEDRKQMMDEL